VAVYPFTQSPTSRSAGDRGERRPHALLLRTDGEAMRVGRPLKVDLRATPLLTWEWKALDLPEHGDVRHASSTIRPRASSDVRGMKAPLRLDTDSPLGTESRPDELDIFDRVLIVVRSGPRPRPLDAASSVTCSPTTPRLRRRPRPIKWVGSRPTPTTRARAARPVRRRELRAALQARLRRVRVVAWNIRAGGGVRADAIARQLARWQADVVALSEFRATPPSARLAARLAACGLAHQLATCDPRTMTRNALLVPRAGVAARSPALRPRERCRWLLVTSTRRRGS